MVEKRTHFGMAGHYAAMSEFLLRGYNVAVPSVDVGDDVFVVDDQEGSLRRVQVKTADAGVERETRTKDGRITQKIARYTLSRRQLKEEKASDLFFMLMVRWSNRWRFLLVPRQTLADLRDDFSGRDRTHTRGPKPKPDADAKSDGLGLDVTWTETDAMSSWDASNAGASFGAYLDTWPTDLPELKAGPGAVKPVSAP